MSEVWEEAALYCARNLDEAVTREVAKEQDRLRIIMQERAAAERAKLRSHPGQDTETK